MAKQIFLVGFLSSFLTACSAMSQSDLELPPDTEPQQLGTMPEESRLSNDYMQPKVITTAMAESAPDHVQAKHTPPPSRQAVLDLLAQSKSLIDQGDYSEAESRLKRALRIEPGNAWLWHNMAVLKFYQADYQQAIQQALKSNNLEKNDNRLKASNYDIIRQSYIEVGDYKKARQY